MKSNVLQFPRARVDPPEEQAQGDDTQHGSGGDDVIRILIKLDAAEPREEPATPPKAPSRVAPFLAGVVTTWLFGA